MTEISVKSNDLPAALQHFVLHWGEMGAVWGVNRSVGQVHALLYLSAHPMTAEDISERLSLARSNVSNSLKELMSWTLVRRVHVMGDRRDFFEAETDVWEIATRIAEGRKAREIDPTLDVLRSCAGEADDDVSIDPIARTRIHAMLTFLESLDTWASDFKRVPKGKLAVLMKLGGAVVRFLPTRNRSSPESR